MPCCILLCQEQPCFAFRIKAEQISGPAGFPNEYEKPMEIPSYPLLQPKACQLEFRKSMGLNSPHKIMRKVMNNTSIYAL